MGTDDRQDKPVGPMDADVRKKEAQLKRWATKIDELAVEAAKARAHSTIEYRLSIDDLKAKRALAQVLFEEYRAAGHDQWEGMRAGIDRAWSDLEAAFKELK